MQENNLNTSPTTKYSSDDRGVRRIGTIFLIVTLVISGVWAFLAPLDEAALASGVVMVKSHKKTIQHLDGGIVSQLVVKDGDIVKQGDLLVTLDGTADKAQLEIARGQFIATVAQLARYEAEREGKSVVNYPLTLDDEIDPRVVEAKQSENQIFKARKSAFLGEIALLKQRADQLSSKIEGLKGQRTSKQLLVSSYSDEAKDLTELLEKGFTDKQRLRDVTRNHAVNTGEISALSAEIASTQIQISETKLEIIQLEKKFQEEVAKKLSELQTQLYDINQRILAINDKVVRVEIKAPVAGRVMGLAVHTLGGVILPGHPILEIVPQTEELVIDAQVSPMDIDRVSVGLVAEVRFSAFKQALTPVIEGKVINISADRILDERSGMPYYQAQVELTPESAQKITHLDLVPGMPVEVLIKTGERTVFEYLIKPITNVFARAFIED
jgi:epimerase transport system membrane fusion protein